MVTRVSRNRSRLHPNTATSLSGTAPGTRRTSRVHQLTRSTAAGSVRSSSAANTAASAGGRRLIPAAATATPIPVSAPAASSSISSGFIGTAPAARDICRFCGRCAEEPGWPVAQREAAHPHQQPDRAGQQQRHHRLPDRGGVGGGEGGHHGQHRQHPGLDEQQHPDGLAGLRPGGLDLPACPHVAGDPVGQQPQHPGDPDALLLQRQQQSGGHGVGDPVVQGVGELPHRRPRA